jgi:uncharacterized membrane protein
VVALIVGPVHGFMLWNAFLAGVPTALALVLFRRRRRAGSAMWWAGAVAWLLFLPNAPYVLTDVVHMVGVLRVSTSDRHSYLVLCTYAVLFAGGLVSYVVSLQLFRRFLHGVIPSRYVAAVLVSVHALCVVAMYLGRVVRVNSWDAVLAPGRVLGSMLHVPQPRTVVLLGTMFVVVGAGACVTAAVCNRALVQLRRWRRIA